MNDMEKVTEEECTPCNINRICKVANKENPNLCSKLTEKLVTGKMPVNEYLDKMENLTKTDKEASIALKQVKKILKKHKVI